MLSFDGRSVVVTGAGRGVGRAHALLLAERGANVVVNDLGTGTDGSGGDEGPAQEVVREIAAAGGSAVANTASVASEAGAASIVASAVESFGGLDAVVNNAGILTTKGFPETDGEDLDRNLAVHLRGSFNVTRAAWPELVRSDAGRVVLTISSAIFGSPELVAYGSAKGGLLGLARNLAAAGRADGVAVNLVAPYARTRMAEPGGGNGGAEGDKTPAAGLEELFARLDPELVSPLVAFLAHQACAVSGEIYSVGGGRVARIFLAETEGIADPHLTPEVVAERWEEIQEESGYFVPPEIGRYTAHFMKRLPAGP